MPRALAERRAVGVAVHQLLQNLCQAQARPACGFDDRRNGPGIVQLRVVGVEIVDAAGELFVGHKWRSV